jgi:hypothetical protein
MDSMKLTLPELEQAINYWRSVRPSIGDERALSPEVNALASLYALMIFHHTATIAIDQIEPMCLQLIDTWRKQAA